MTSLDFGISEFKIDSESTIRNVCIKNLNMNAPRWPDCLGQFWIILLRTVVFMAVTTVFKIQGKCYCMQTAWESEMIFLKHFKSINHVAVRLFLNNYQNGIWRSSMDIHLSSLEYSKTEIIFGKGQILLSVHQWRYTTLHNMLWHQLYAFSFELVWRFSAFNLPKYPVRSYSQSYF